MNLHLTGIVQNFYACERCMWEGFLLLHFYIYEIVLECEVRTEFTFVQKSSKCSDIHQSPLQMNHSINHNQLAFFTALEAMV